MMHPLGKTYPIAGLNLDIYYETGKHLGGQAFERVDGERFRVSYDLDCVGLEDGHCVSVATFGRNGPMFLAYNHSNGQQVYCPDAINDLWYLAKDRMQFSGFWGQQKLNLLLKYESRTFPQSSFFDGILAKLRMNHSVRT